MFQIYCVWWWLIGSNFFQNDRKNKIPIEIKMKKYEWIENLSSVCRQNFTCIYDFFTFIRNNWHLFIYSFISFSLVCYWIIHSIFNECDIFIFFCLPKTKINVLYPQTKNIITFWRFFRRRRNKQIEKIGHFRKHYLSKILLKSKML